jgi:uncharacterized protein
MRNFEIIFENYMARLCDQHPDPSHDLLHVKRVVGLAKQLAQAEGADAQVVVPAAFLHDCVYVSKTDSLRAQASRLSADKALEILKECGYPQKYFPDIRHAIVAHSFSAQIHPETIEAKVVQDADRLDAMGAIGIARCFALSGLTKRPLYFSDDPFCKDRKPDDKQNSLDHFFIKLLRLQEKLHTKSAQREAVLRVETMRNFLKSLERELETTNEQ